MKIREVENRNPAMHKLETNQNERPSSENKSRRTLSAIKNYPKRIILDSYRMDTDIK